MHEGGARTHGPGMHLIPITLERRFQLPANAAPRLVEDIETYSAFVDLQNKLSATAPWYQRLA